MDNLAQVEVKLVCGRWAGNVSFCIDSLLCYEVDRGASWWVRPIDEDGTICNILASVYLLGVDGYFDSIPIAEQVVVGGWVWNVALLAIEYEEDIILIVGVVGVIILTIGSKPFSFKIFAYCHDLCPFRLSIALSVMLVGIQVM